MYKVRDDEPGYAFVPVVTPPKTNRYGKTIQLVDEHDRLAGKSLHINGDEHISDNPNRYKQHGFYFNADNCISCHACESACSEKNGLPPYLAYRAVGYVEGGTYPNYTRLNISMACNHCDNPVCLKGCPTRAYTKFAEYGAVLQDPDICFGCGYCTWVCPYNAPQLDTKRGHVHKCNMCVDRLEAGLKPACAAACLAGALDFGIVETTPENRVQLENQIPGFPSPGITHPNIRFQQTKSLPREMTRPDSIALRYERDDQGQGTFKTKVRDLNKTRQWNLRKLHSREDPLVIFTLITQGVIGAFAALFLLPQYVSEEFSIQTHPVLYPVLLFCLLGLQTFALVLSTFHLGRPHRFYRAFNNLRYSPVSREVAGIAIFYNLLAGYSILTTLPGLFTWLPPGVYTGFQQFCGWSALLAGPVAIYFMQRIYRIKARPFWNHWQTLSAFYGNTLALGSMVVLLSYAIVNVHESLPFTHIVHVLTLPLACGLLLEAIGLFAHYRAMHKQTGEGAASLYEQRTTFGKTYIARNSLLLINLVAVIVLRSNGIDGLVGLTAWMVLGISILITALIGRAMFYVLVTPTTMPGAFFWRNRGFQEHARETGLATMPQVGVLVNDH